MTARFPHRTGADVVIVLAKVATFLEHRAAFNRRQTRGVNPQRLTASVHIDRRDARPMRRRLPVREVKGLLHRSHAETLFGPTNFCTSKFVMFVAVELYCCPSLRAVRREIFIARAFLFSNSSGFAQKVDPIWNEPVSTGSAGALARSTLNPKPLDAVTVSRFALIAGEGARAPSMSMSRSAHPLFGQGQLKLRRSEDFVVPKGAWDLLGSRRL